jgi:hypothetical protein
VNSRGAGGASVGRALRALAVGLAFGLSAGPAWEATSRADGDAARAAFRNGVDLYDKQRWAEALEAFEAAYREKPSPVIWQNIGLCQRRLGHLALAATAFDRALDEGRATLRPATRAAIAQELAELEVTVATLRVRVIDGSGAPVPGARVTVDGTELTASALARAVRLEPGTHVVEARAEGFADPPPKTLALEQGSPVDATFALEARTGLAPLPPGDQAVIEMMPPPRASAPPPTYEAPARPPPAPKRFVIGVTAGLASQSLRLGEGAGEAPAGERRAFFGGALGLRGGYRLGRHLAAELRGEAGSVTSTYALDASTPRDTKTEVSHVALTPGLRFATVGSPRLTAATGVGLHATTVATAIARLSATSATTEKRRGTGLAGSWLVDAGVQFDAGPIVLEVAFAMEVQGVSSARDDVAFARMLLASPSVRYGGRVGLLIPF